MPSTYFNEKKSATDSQKPPRNKARGKKKPFQGPRKNLRNETLQPEALNGYPYINDPLFLEIFDIEGEYGLTVTAPVEEFYADASGYVELVEEEYNVIASVDRTYATCVPHSAHAYYHHIIWWYKVALCDRKHGVGTESQINLINFIEGCSPEMGAVAGLYLEGLGDFKDLTGVGHRIRVPHPNESGHFGRATAETHGYYESVPAPAVSLQRVLEDIAASTDRDRDPIWDIQSITPLPVTPPAQTEEQHSGSRETLEQEKCEEGALDGIADTKAVELEPSTYKNRPTVNLLGWRQATKLNVNQLTITRSIFEGGERDFSTVDLVNTHFGLCRSLFDYVRERIAQCKLYNIVTVPTNTIGSVVQQTVWEPCEFSTDPNVQLISYAGCLKSRTMMPITLASAGKLTCYKTLRPEFKDERGVTINPWSCYAFDSYTKVPQDWRNNRNSLAARGFHELIYYTPFKTPITERRNNVDTILEKIGRLKV